MSVSCFMNLELLENVNFPVKLYGAIICYFSVVLGMFCGQGMFCGL